MLNIISNNINKDIAYVLEDKTYLFCEDWNGENYRNGVKNGVNTNCKYKPVYKYQIENIDISKLEEKSDKWLNAVKIIGFEVI